MFTQVSFMTIIYFFATIAYLLMASNLFFSDNKSNVSKIFGLTMLALSGWACSLGLSSLETDLTAVIRLKRFFVIFWAFFFVLFLHSVILLTNSRKLLKNKFLVVLMYIPAFITYCTYSLIDATANKIFILEPVWYGWKSFEPPSIWMNIFRLYYLTYLLTSFIILVKWRKDSIFFHQKRIANLILASYAATFLTGVVIDFTVANQMGIYVPDISCLLAAFPIGAIYYAIKKFKLMALTPTNIANDIMNNIDECFFLLDLNGNIKMTNEATSVLLRYSPEELIDAHINVIFKEKDLISFSAHSFIKENGKLKSASELKLPKDLETIAIAKRGQEVVVQISLSTVMDSYGNLLGVVCVITDMTAIKNSQMQLKQAHDELEKKVIERTAELSRLNEILQQEMDDKQSQVVMQTMLSEISSDFITVNSVNLNEKINSLIKKTGLVTKVDRVCVFECDIANREVKCSHEWTVDGNNILLVGGSNSFSGDFTWWCERIQREGFIHCPDIESLPDEAKIELQGLRAMKTKSIISISISNSDNIYGFISLETIDNYKSWSEQEISLLNLIANILADGIAKVEAEKEIQHLAYNDHLTGLKNRVSIISYIDYLISQKKYNHRLLGLIFVDLDGFKFINDSMGHDGGDELLKIVANSLVTLQKDGITISRVGGDEFVFVVDAFNDKNEFISFTNSILDIFNTPFLIGEQEFFVTASAGISLYPYDGMDADMLMRNANLAMNLAKEKGKNRFEFCSDEIKDAIDRKAALVTALHHAIERDELVLYYQPQVDTETEEIIGVEALIRWRHSELGLVSPGLFIPLAEQNGLINSFGQWILDTACEQNKKWQDMGLKKIVVAVNLSVQQFKNPDLYKDIQEALDRSNLDPKYLELEITESVAMKEKDGIVDMLTKIKKMGCDIAIDDFGTDFSSLSRLKELPIDKIKIAMEFIRGLEHDEKDKAIAMVIIMLGRNLDLKLIAEGVEDEYQLEFLRDRMCDQIQGYYFYKPMPAEEVEKLLREGK